MKIDKVVLKETLYIALWTIGLSVIMEVIFVFIGWDYTVILGNLLGGLGAILNFFLMGITVQSALKREEKNAKSLVRVSMALRFVMLIAVAIVGAAVPCFNVFATIIPLLFPRIGMFVRPLIDKARGKNGKNENDQV